MIKIAIIDDNNFYIDNIKNLLSENIQDISYTISEFTSANSFLAVIDTHSFDIIFLDILLGKENGIELGEQINAKHPNTNIIFISVNTEYFKDVYKVNHSYFLTKEFEEDRFRDAVSKALKNICKKNISIDTKNGTHKLDVYDIWYCESYLRHTKVYSKDGEVSEYNITLKEIEALLPESLFVRTHQSFIINLNYIKKYDRQNIYIGTDTVIPISRTYINSVRDKITRYLGGIL